MFNPFTRKSTWRAGLTHIWCTDCKRDLDWAPPEFVARHPNPVCGSCRTVRNQLAAEAAARSLEIEEMGRATARALIQYHDPKPALEKHHAFVIDGEAVGR